MSKVGQKPIKIENGVTVTVDGSDVHVKGPKGNLSVTIPRILKAKLEGAVLTVSRENESATAKSMHGLFRTLISNATVGVTKGWEKKLEVVGTGYGVSMKGSDAVFKVGYSHQVVFPKVEGLTFSVDGPTMFVITGVDKQLVGEVAHKARKIKPPDPYKGKGVRYHGEVIKLKAGKKAKTA